MLSCIFIFAKILKLQFLPKYGKNCGKFGKDETVCSVQDYRESKQSIRYDVPSLRFG